MAATIDDLSQAIMSWLDQRPQRFAERSRSPTWSTKELRDSFRSNLETALLASITASKWIDVIAQLADAFMVSAASGALEIHRWMVAPYEGPHPQTFDVMRAEIAQLLDREVREGRGISGYQPTELAGLIVQALNDALRKKLTEFHKKTSRPKTFSTTI
jgi:hypothetical protein